MASADDYVNLRFGSFIIDHQLGAGAEAEVYLVRHEATGRFLVLRLDANDNRIWEAEPVIPPFNNSIERKNVWGSFFISIGQHERKADRRKRWPFRRKQWIIRTVTIYGVLDLRYLIPLSNPFKVKHSIGIRHLLDIAPADDLYLFEFWEDIALTMLSDAHSVNQGGLSEDMWDRKWRNLTGGTILTAAIRSYLEGGNLTGTEKDAIITRISASGIMGPELAENLLVRLCGCVSRGRISLEAAKATLRCQHFRANLSLHEIRQFMDCGNILREETMGQETSLSLATEILGCLQYQPYSMSEESEFFEYAFPAGPHEIGRKDEDFQAFIENHGVDNFSLFLQEYAAEQPFVTVTRERYNIRGNLDKTSFT